MAPSIRKMPVIRDNPNWSALLTFDGFKSHVNVQEALHDWSVNLIWTLKKEAGTSHGNQAYNQYQARADKQITRDLLDACRGKVNGHIDQNQLVSVLILGIRNLPKKTWVASFKSINLHSKHRILFDTWYEKCISI